MKTWTKVCMWVSRSTQYAQRMVFALASVWYALVDLWYPRDRVHVFSVLAINNRDPEEPEGLVQSIDLSWAHRCNPKQDLRLRCGDLSDYHIEYRFRYNHQKYRYAVSASEDSIDIPFPFPEPVGFAPRPMFAWLCDPNGNEEPVYARVLKYAGPKGDFYGGNTVRAQWLFPWWTKESFEGLVLRVMDTHMHLHEFPLAKNPYLTLN